ncbi:SDR family oxidoreductase [Solirubrobacter soli]|uniref:SDR family oxidoreductase n=1 Tax=Solirubrobacter soli TaxID=363832 RepID=UPI0012F85DAD
MATLAPAQMQLTTGRFVTPQEIADAVALLASPRSASTTGAEWVVDGGILKALWLRSRSGRRASRSGRSASRSGRLRPTGR